MSSLPAAAVLQADPASLRALDRYLSLGLPHLRGREPFAALTAPQWAVLVELLLAWARGDDTVSQAEVARLSGYCDRTVRRLVDDLEEVHLVVASRDAGRGVTYLIGPELAEALRDFSWGLSSSIWVRGTAWLRESSPDRESTPDRGSGIAPSTPDRGSGIPSATPHRESTPDRGSSIAPSTPDRGSGVIPVCTPAASGSAIPLGAAIASNLQRIRVSPDAASATPDPRSGVSTVPAPTSASLLIKNKNLRSSSSPEKPTGPANPTPAPAEPQATPDTRRAVAFRALTARYHRGFPDRSSPTSFAAADIETVVAVTAGLDLSEPALDQLHADAIAGAWDKSKRKPPTVGFIWGNQEYFLQNAADGGAEREAAARIAAADSARRAKQAEPQERVVSFEETHDFAKDIGQRLARIAEADPPRPKNVRFFPIPEPTTEPKDNDHE